MKSSCHLSGIWFPGSRIEEGMKKRAKDPCKWFLKRRFPDPITYRCYLHAILQDLIMWPHLAEREAGKYPYSGWSCAQLKLSSIIKEKGENKYWGPLAGSAMPLFLFIMVKEQAPGHTMTYWRAGIHTQVNLPKSVLFTEPNPAL